MQTNTMRPKASTVKATPRFAVAGFAATFLAGALLAGLTGCGLGAGTVAAPVSPVAPTGSITVSGTVFGGKQPIGGATVSLYAASLTGYGTASVQVGPSVTSSTVAGATYGTFSLSASASAGGCTAGALVYAVSSGGNTGAGTNTSSVLIAPLGSCSSASTNYPHFVINETTTVGAVWALAPFMSSSTQVATSATNVAGLTEAFANATQLSNIIAGVAPGINLPPGTTVPQATIYTIADILAACVNGATGNSNCSTLFTNANMGTTPTNTTQAALIMAQNPALTAAKISNLYGLVSPTSPYQPTLSAAPGDLTLAMTYAPSTLNTPSALAIDGSGQVWLTNSGSNSVTVLSNAGVVNTGLTGGASSLNAPSAIAIDASGNAWVANKGSNTVSEVTTSNGNGGSPFSGGFSSPSGIAIDNQGSVWVSNGGANSVNKLVNGVASGPYTLPGLSGPVAIAINPH